MDSMNIYDRQQTLNLKIPDSVAIIGVGGVGSWVAVDLALTGVKKIVLVDHDIIEAHNLNRTPFKSSQIGQPKVLAIVELIYERRTDVQIIPFQSKLEDLTEYQLDMLKNCEVIIDCRDTTNPPLPSELAKKQVITAGYDGFSVSIHINPDYKSIWGEEQVRYTITPSFLVPPQFLAVLIVLYIVVPEIRFANEKILSFDMRDIFKILMEGLK